MIAETVFKNIVKERRIVTPAGNMYWLDSRVLRTMAFSLDVQLILVLVGLFRFQG